MKKMLLLGCAAAIGWGQVTIPDGTKIRLRLDQTLTSATADEGQTVELSVTEAVKVDGQVVIPENARATGTVVLAQAKRRMGRAGKLDFSVDRVRAADGEWVPVRYTLNKKNGDSKAVSTGIITAGVAVVFWPAAPFVLLRHGKDITINKGVVFDVFTDTNHQMVVKPATQQPQPPAITAAPAPVPGTPALSYASVQPVAAAQAQSITGEAATLNITSSEPGAEIEINGGFVGSTPTTLKLNPGQYNITVRRGTQTWQRVMQVSAGSHITVNAVFEPPLKSAVVRQSR